ncbi:MAG: hypothetical protein R3321_02580, partial [Nitrososphaeraceae archaeon]|nr:hypothetical protein [Nitrososphaeraceae archaeon]
IGVTNDPDPINMGDANYFDNINILCFGKDEGDTTWRTIRANGGTHVDANTKTENESVNTLIITGSSSNFTVKHNADSVNTYTTTIPSSTSPLSIVIIAGAESTTDKTFRILDVDLSFTFQTEL